MEILLFEIKTQIFRSETEAKKAMKGVTTIELESWLTNLRYISKRLGEILDRKVQYDGSMGKIQNVADYSYMVNVTEGEVRTELWKRRRKTMSKAQKYSPYIDSSPNPVMKLSAHSRRTSIIRGISI